MSAVSLFSLHRVHLIFFLCFFSVIHISFGLFGNTRIWPHQNVHENNDSEKYGIYDEWTLDTVNTGDWTSCLHYFTVHFTGRGANKLPCTSRPIHDFSISECNMCRKIKTFRMVFPATLHVSIMQTLKLMA